MALNAYAVPHHPRFQEAADDPQQPLVAHMSGQTGHQHVVVHPVERTHNLIPPSRTHRDRV